MYTRIEVKNGYTDSLGGQVLGASYFLCDADVGPDGKDPDIEFLPTKGIGPGSKALCITSGNVYILGPSKVWKKYKGVSMIN